LNIYVSLKNKSHDMQSEYAVNFLIPLHKFQTINSPQIYTFANSHSSAQFYAAQRIDMLYRRRHSKIASGIASGPVTLTQGKRIGTIIR